MPEVYTDVSTVLPKLAEIEREITEMNTVQDFAPLSLTANDLPTFVNLPRRADINTIQPGEDFAGIEIFIRRVYQCNLYVATAGSGTSGEPFAACEPFFDRVGKVFVRHPAVLLTLGVLNMDFQGDDGVDGNMVYAGLPFYGIRFRVQVTTRARVLYANLE